MKTIEVSDYLYGLLEEESARRVEEGWMEGAWADRVAAEGIAFFMGYDLVPSFYDLDNRKDAFKNRPSCDIDEELKEGIEAVEESNRHYEQEMGIA